MSVVQDQALTSLWETQIPILTIQGPYTETLQNPTNPL